MRILYWTQAFWPSVGGVEADAMRLLPAMRARGCEFVVVTSAHSGCPAGSYEFSGIPVRRFDFGGALARKDLPGIAEIKRGVATLKRWFQPDAVHVQLTDPSVYFHLLTQRDCAAGTLISVRRVLEGSCLRADSLIGRALSACTWVTANSRAVHGRLAAAFGDLRERMSVLYVGIPLPALPPTDLFAGAPTVLGVGRLVGEKGFDVVVEAFGRVVRKVPEARLVLAGDGPERAALQRQARSLSRSHAVEFLGWVEPGRIAELVNRSSLVVVPSRVEEALGQVAIQAAQMGRPVIASEVGGLSEVVRASETGLLVGDHENPQCWADAMVELLSHTDRARQMGAAARDWAACRFSWDNYLAEHERLYRLVAEGS